MSKHWSPKPQSGWAGQLDRHRGPVRRRRGGHVYEGGRAGRLPLRWSELRLMLLGGIALGLGVNGYFEGGMDLRPLPGGSAVVVPAGAVRVIDGDTFAYLGEKIRIADIDTPEVDGRCASESALAARATERLEALLDEGPFELHLNPDGRDEDRYGRKLRIVVRGGHSVGDVLVAEGLARTWTGRREGWCA